MKSTNSLLESEVASMEEELQRKKEERDVEKQMEKKRIKDLERDKQLEKDARVRMLKGYIFPPFIICPGGFLFTATPVLTAGPILVIFGM